MRPFDRILNHPGANARRRWAAGVCCLLLVTSTLLAGCSGRHDPGDAPDTDAMLPVIEAWLVEHQDEIAVVISRQASRDPAVTENRATSTVVQVENLTDAPDFDWGLVTVIDGDTYGERKYRVSLRVPASIEVNFGDTGDTRRYLISLDLWLDAVGDTISGQQTVPNSYLAVKQ
jgi:hypothetical protein